ncbi:hypothetical protein [Candidatus Magnetaquicoccus inordinatus]|uniref:hypothetical protein n=1 Tax=Candidatus Magnetaquicoccus inordinatus TaxID=2496818 RepID=UPI00102BC63E|nr:hypothetical protein [Candidatus Magnetaquicoccus inordinatus]
MNWQRETVLPLLLLLSLAGNLFAAGLLLGSNKPAALPPATGNLQQTTGETTTGETVQQGWQHSPLMHTLHQQEREQLRQRMHNLHAAQQQIRQILQNATWDPQSLEQALAHLRRQTTAAQEEWHQLLLTSAARLPSSERAQLANWSMRPGMGRGRGMGRHTPDSPP